MTEIAQLHTQYNLLKIHALEIFNSFGPLNPPAWAALANFVPKRAAYTYLLRLHRFGLLNRSRDKFGLLIYSLSDRGHERLNWLTLPSSPTPSDASREEPKHGH